MHVVHASVLEGWGLLSDEQMVSRILSGQTALFEVLMRRHNERIYRAARAILRDESEAEDVMQQAYVNAYATCVSSTAGRSSRPGSLESPSTRRSRAFADVAGTRIWIQTARSQRSWPLP